MRCAECGAKRRSGSGFSPLGEPVCARCSDTLLGLITGGAAAGLGGAVAGPSIMRWVRESLHPDQRAERKACSTPPQPAPEADNV